MVLFGKSTTQAQLSKCTEVFVVETLPQTLLAQLTALPRAVV